MAFWGCPQRSVLLSNLMVKLVSMYASSTAEFSCPGVQNDVTARVKTSWTGFWYCAQDVFDV